MAKPSREQLIQAGAGYLLSAFADIACSTLDLHSLESPADLSDEQLGSIGKAAGADERVCINIAGKLRRHYHKSWSTISEEEWLSFSSQFPESAQYLSSAMPCG